MGSAVDFARRLSTMQTRVLEAERDVVLGGQVLISRSAPPTGDTRLVTAPLAAAPLAADACPDPCSGVASPGDGATSSSRPRPPMAPPSRDDMALFSRPQVLHAGSGGLCAGRKFIPSSGTARRARSSSQRLDPLENESVGLNAFSVSAQRPPES